jgi:phage baseplate assembly protein W
LKKNRTFLGRGWSFPPEFNDQLREPVMVSDEEDISQSLWILLKTSPGERLMLPEYGCNLRKFVFTGIDATSIALMKEMISTAIIKFEARIDLNELVINTDNVLDGLVLIEIQYTIRTTNSRSNLVYPFYLNEGTLIQK